MFDYQYNLTDHLGNVRNVLNASGTSIQSNDYYPFGLTHSAPTNFTKNKYLYNGKEAQDETIGGTIYNVLDYHARSYDPVIGRMHEPDPMLEKYYEFSIYNYCGNDPINRIDPNGMDWYQDDDGNLYWRKSSEETLEINGIKLTNIGNSVSLQYGENQYINFYQNVGYQNDHAYNTYSKILNDDYEFNSLAYGDNSPLWDGGKKELRKSVIYRGQKAFVSHPVTKATVEAMAFIVNGGIDLGFLIGKSIAKQFTKEFSKHALERMTQRGVTKGMARIAIKKGTKYFDPKNKSYCYVIEKGFASGKDLLVGTNVKTGTVTTVIRDSKQVRKRFIKIR